MSDFEMKPLKWKPDPNVGYSVIRRQDGGMQFTFSDVETTTLEHWRDFALQHLYDSDRLTRNLYDLRQIETITEEAVKIAVEANSDPAARNIRLAVVVANEGVRKAILEIAALTTIPGGVEMKIFTNLDDAEEWLSRPLDLII
ncbi:MAG: STAS/SEC14 domain-containing protein [Anaerolineales bacterium]